MGRVLIGLLGSKDVHVMIALLDVVLKRDSLRQP
jgi:hypothetical protein